MWKTKSFSSRSGTRQRCMLLLFLFNTVLEVLATVIQTRKRNKRHPNWKEGSKALIVCRWHDSVHRKSYRLHWKTTQTNKWIWQNSGIQSQYSEIEGILYTNNEISETEIRKKILFDIATRKPNQGGKRPVLRKLHNTEERN